MHRISVGIIELLEQPDELFLVAGLHPKIINVQIVSLVRKRCLSHGALLVICLFGIYDGILTKSSKQHPVRPLMPKHNRLGTIVVYADE
jgi:hypothetical protein